jgi:Fe-S cluster biogenesis protein NfuA
MVSKEDVERALEDIRIPLQAHGGDVKLVAVEDDGTVKVQLTGACAGCPMAQMTIRHGVEARLKQEVPGVLQVVAVDQAE